jgi:hypothetical protein
MHPYLLTGRGWKFLTQDLDLPPRSFYVNNIGYVLPRAVEVALSMQRALRKVCVDPSSTSRIVCLDYDEDANIYLRHGCLLYEELESRHSG